MNSLNTNPKGQQFLIIQLQFSLSSTSANAASQYKNKCNFPLEILVECICRFVDIQSSSSVQTRARWEDLPESRSVHLLPTIVSLTLLASQFQLGSYGVLVAPKDTCYVRSPGTRGGPKKDLVGALPHI